MKKLLSLILALALVMSLSVTAFASGNDNPYSGGTSSQDVTANYIPKFNFKVTLTLVDTNGEAITGNAVSANLAGSDGTVAGTVTTESSTNLQLSVGNYTLQSWTAIPANYGAPGDIPLTVTEEGTITSENPAITITNSTTEEGEKEVLLTVKLEAAEAAAISGMRLTIGNKSYTGGKVEIYTTDSVTITISGANFGRLNANNMVNVTGTAEVLCTDNGWTIDETANTATQTYSGSAFSGNPTLQYSNDGGTTWTTCMSVKYISETTSVDISWGSMHFTYQDGTATSVGGWSCADGANKITVNNTNGTNIYAEMKYTSGANYSEITGKFNSSWASLSPGSNQIFILSLEGKPAKALNNATIGQVTVTIKNCTTVRTAEDLQIAVTSGKNVMLLNNIDLGYESLKISDSQITIDLDNHELTSSNMYTIEMASGTCTILNGTVTNSHKEEGEYPCAVYCTSGTIRVKNCEIHSRASVLDRSLFIGDVAELEDCNMDTIAVNANSQTLTFSGQIRLKNPLEGYTQYCKITALAGIYDFDPTAYVDPSVCTVTHEEGSIWWTVTAK